MANVKPIPDGYHTASPFLTIKGASEALDFYTKAFGATDIQRMPGPGGLLMHAEFKIGDSMIMCHDEMPPEMGGGGKSPLALGGTPVTIFLYVPDVDAVFNSAVAAGGKPIMPPEDQFWGDRFAMVIDPFGHSWAIATHIEDPSAEEITRRMEAQFSAAPS